MEASDGIPNTLLANLRETTGIEGAWQANTHLDGIVELELPQSHLRFKIDIKKELRAHQLQQIEHVAQKFPPYLLVAHRLFPKMKETLRQLGIAYLEANGNIFRACLEHKFCNHRILDKIIWLFANGTHAAELATVFS
ncbi:MAG: hypothetical protein J5I98_07685 [Phaeodactylibacter sp.]|nr:hypothetical protein [Phaeodactylibacter sp.]